MQRNGHDYICLLQNNASRSRHPIRQRPRHIQSIAMFQTKHCTTAATRIYYRRSSNIPCWAVVNTTVALDLAIRFTGQRCATHIANCACNKRRICPAFCTQAGAVFGRFRTRQAPRRIDNIQQCALSLGGEAGYLIAQRDLRICRHHQTFLITNF